MPVETQQHIYPSGSSPDAGRAPVPDSRTSAFAPPSNSDSAAFHAMHMQTLHAQLQLQQAQLQAQAEHLRLQQMLLFGGNSAGSFSPHTSQSASSPQPPFLPGANPYLFHQFHQQHHAPLPGAATPQHHHQLANYQPFVAPQGSQFGVSGSAPGYWPPSGAQQVGHPASTASAVDTRPIANPSAMTATDGQLARVSVSPMTGTTSGSAGHTGHGGSSSGTASVTTAPKPNGAAPLVVQVAAPARAPPAVLPPAVSIEERRQIIVKFLTEETTEVEFRRLFARIGPVEHVRIICDKATGRTKGYGFVDFTSAVDAAAAVKRMRGYPLCGKRLKVSFVSTARRDAAHEDVSSVPDDDLVDGSALDERSAPGDRVSGRGTTGANGALREAADHGGEDDDEAAEIDELLEQQHQARAAAAANTTATKVCGSDVGGNSPDDDARGGTGSGTDSSTGQEETSTGNSSSQGGRSTAANVVASRLP